MSDVSTVSRLPTASNPAYADELSSLAGFDREVKTTLDQTDFLELLSTQLANQDPLSPSSDLNSIAQMASFTSAQQMSELVTSLKSFIVTQDFSSTQAMLGKYVTATTDTTRTTASGAVITEKISTSGVVTSVGYTDEGVSMIKIGDKTFSPSDVTGISDSAAAAIADTVSDPVDTTQSLIGKYVTVTAVTNRTTDSGATLRIKTATSGVVTASGSDTAGKATIKIGDETYYVADITAINATKSKTST